MSEVEERLKLNIPDSDMEIVKFNKSDVVINPFISVTNKVAIIKEYINNLFDESEDDLTIRYFSAEYSMIMQILDLQTNIDIAGMDINNVISSKLWDLIKNKLCGWNELREDLNKVLEMRQAQELLNRSVGNVLENISVKIMNVLDTISEINPESFAKISEEFSYQISNLNQHLPGIIDNSPVPKTSVPKTKRTYTKKAKK